MERTIINIDKGMAHVYESMQKSQIQVEKPEPAQPANDAELFSTPNTSWAFLAMDDE
ncbi:hypothetical protein [Mucilaginibacter sp. PPCGB 2223]|uniref:hypothetical protein n=1 Tax=Mucilaginibacter sp. PPCGB 2223 TaxID=1886027 RepID=UPI0015868D1E|nr:hypothetical protein [Mucilaginibacter sp. PPCGB 2223]